MWVFAAVSMASAGCAGPMVERAAATVRTAPTAQRVLLSAAAYRAACPTPFREALGSISDAGLELGALLEMKAAAEAPMLWMEVCGGSEGLRVLADSGAVAPSERRAVLWKRCELGERGWMTEVEWLVAPGLMVAPWMAGAELQQQSATPKQVRLLVRGLAGLPE